MKKTVDILLSDTSATMAGLYRPKTAETKHTFEVMLSFIQEILDTSEREVLHGAVDEVLRVLKSEKVRETDKKKEVEALLYGREGKMPDERFALLVNLSKKITDFTADEDEAAYNVSIFFGKLFFGGKIGKK